MNWLDEGLEDMHELEKEIKTATYRLKRKWFIIGATSQMLVSLIIYWLTNHTF